MAKCKHYEICGREGKNAEEGLCVLHSRDHDKDKDEFKKVLEEHREENGDNFSLFVFPEDTNFTEVIFPNEVLFTQATFIGRADFSQAKFTDYANFLLATFVGEADFFGAEFSKMAFFSGAEFTREAEFFGAKFRDGASFQGTKFVRRADFDYTQFLGRTVFSAPQIEGRKIPIFSGIKVDFESVEIDPLDALTFRDADLRMCSFQGTDLRKVEITGADWPKKRGRFCVYDELRFAGNRLTHPWPHIERVYRELKQNYEDRRDYERASDFHYGEKEMRRKNPQTSWGLWSWLTLYWMVSGYGERWARPLAWTLGLLAVSTFCYLWRGLLRLKDAGPVLDWTMTWEVGLYSLKVMTLLKPSNFEPVGFWGDFINTAQSLLGPLLIGLFALALRQRLKR